MSPTPRKTVGSEGAASLELNRRPPSYIGEITGLRFASQQPVFWVALSPHAHHNQGEAIKMQTELWFALACALLALGYGGISVKWILAQPRK